MTFNAIFLVFRTFLIAVYAIKFLPQLITPPRHQHQAHFPICPMPDVQASPFAVLRFGHFFWIYYTSFRTATICVQFVSVQQSHSSMLTLLALVHFP